MASTAPRVLHRLRCEMRRHGLAAVVVLSQDDHNSEYPALRFQRRALLSGFTGSAGTAVITAVPVPRSMLPDAAAVTRDVATNDEAIDAAGEFENCGALVWADGRYWEQAAGQLHPGWCLMKDMRGEVGNVTPDAWVARLLSSLEATDSSTQKTRPDSENNAAPARKVACDARTMSVAEWDKFSKRFSDAVGTDVLVSFDSLLDTHVDGQVASDSPPSSRLTLVDQVLSEFDLLPPLPSTTIVAHPERFTGRSVAAKLRDVAASMRSVGCDAVVVAALDDVAWLFNLRSCPMPEGWTTPVFYAYAIVARSPESDAITATLFVDLPTDPSAGSSSSLDWMRSLPNVSVTIDGVDQTAAFARTVNTNTPQNVEGSGEAVAVTVRPYAEFFAALAGPSLQTARVSVEETVTSFAVLETLKGRRGGAVTKTKGLVAHLKCIKNDVELAGFRASHVRDGAALTQFLAWTEYEVLRRAGLQSCSDADGGSNHEDAASSAYPLPGSATGMSDRHRVITDRNSVGVSEVEADSVLTLFRAQQAHYRGKSFDTIVGSGADGAVIHKTSIDADTFISPTELLLVDSGAQYLDGTTDITRTICFTSEKAMWWAEHMQATSDEKLEGSREASQRRAAQIKDMEAFRRAANIGGESRTAVLKDASGFREERRAYTLVLKGHIALNKLVFPTGILGQRLDSFARQALWQYGLDYVHGTSHGVGSHLCVHEGPMGIGAGAQNPATAAGLQRGMVVSNEPGFYVPGRYGIRIENLDEIVAAEPLRFHLLEHQQNSGGRSGGQAGANETDGQQGEGHKTEAHEFLTLRSIALAPLCRELIEVVLLSPEETTWVDTYHARVRAEVEPLLCGDARAAAYLEWHTRPLLEK